MPTVTGVDESVLVTALSRGDREALSTAYRQYAGRLQAYAWRLLGDAEEAGAVVQDTFDLVAWHADELRDPHRLRAWLYAIVWQECHRRGRKARRDAGEVRPLEADGVDPASATRSAYAVDLVRAAMATLTARDQEIAELSIRHGLVAGEIGAVLSVSPSRAYDRSLRARAQLEDAVDALIALADGRCRLVRSLPGWSGPLNRHRLRRVTEHIEDCSACRAIRRELPSAATLLATYASLPFVQASSWLTVRATPDWEPRWSHRTGFPQPPVRRTRRLLVATATLAVAFVVAGVALRVSDGTPAGATAQESPSPGASTGAPSPSSTPSPALLSPSPSLASPSPLQPGEELPAREPTPGSSAVVVRLPLTVGASAAASCGDKARFVLAVAVTAGADLASATLTWQVGDTRTAAMAVDQRTAYAEVWSAKPRSPITWWVTVTSRDGRTATTSAVTTAHPCA
ncbi:sigma-70 family RNA polymerase sigma factor [Hamadaea sp. NPDC050747]|uniref:RNA polymerase sigma factor n=1 Tax=Hamadaea sp. NPDC050747 TaxID=3155789 RepID=UPI0033C41D33